VTSPDGTISHTADGRIQVRFVRNLDHPATTVWSALSDPAARAVWFFAGRLDMHVGGVVELDDSATGVRGRVLTVEPPHHLTMTWQSLDAPGETLVEFAIADTPAGCTLTVTHTVGEAANPDRLAAGWHTLLDDLPLYVRGDSLTPAGAWSLHLARYGKE
jgi:uncharacterized protein YndB with AHSA1/START domain